MKYAKFRVTLDVTIDKQDIDNQAVKYGLYRKIGEMLKCGKFTEDLPSTVEGSSFTVEVIDNMNSI